MDALFYPLVVVFGAFFDLLEHVLPASLVMPILAILWLGVFAGFIAAAVWLFRRRRLALGAVCCVVATWEFIGPVVLLFNTVSRKP